MDILLAEKRDIIRRGIYAILIEREEVGKICEATTIEEIQLSLSYRDFDLIIIHQSLIKDIAALPEGHFIVLATEVDMEAFQAACIHGACAYLLETASSELLCAVLSLSQDAFLIEPTMARSIIKHLSTTSRFPVKDELLTPREREVTSLLRDGIDRRTIAQRLSISESTLKTHIRNIMRKQEQMTK